MSGQRYTPEFKHEAVRQVVERGYSVSEIAKRLGVSTHSLYKADVFDYIEMFYNQKQRHSHLGGVIPEAFERASY